ncbi:MAG: hypothetical protein NXI10_07970 [bacterium]|nr:hypothetical protein [bacterium]
MKMILLLTSLLFLICSCEMSESDKETDADKRSIQRMNAPKKKVDNSNSEISYEIIMEELYGNWVLIGVSEDRNGPGLAPQGELLFAFRKNGAMTVATEGMQEITENLAEIPSPYSIEETKLCSDDPLFALQFVQRCVEVIRLNEGRMSIAVEIPDVGFIFKHFVKLEE